MKKIISLIICFLILGISISYASTSSSSSWKTPILSNSLQFIAKLDNWKVYMNWTSFYKALWDINEDFKYYKVVRSQSVSNPVYPDNWYIKYESNITKTSYIDKSPKSWISYYRLCAMTYAKNRYCSNVVKITYNNSISNNNWWVNNNWWAKPIFTSKFNFHALLDNGKVYTSWMPFRDILVNKKFKYYKVIRSKSVSNPIYPDNWYINYEPNENIVEYTDNSPKIWINYYRVCAITTEKDRYCSKVVKVIYKKENAVSVTNNSNSYISTSLKIKANNILNNFYRKLEKKYTDSEKRLYILNRTIKSLNYLKSKKQKLKAVIEYMVRKMEERKKKYQDDFSEIESIFNDF